MEPYAYRENLESVLEFTGGAHMISITQAKAYLGLVNPRAIHKRCPYFVDQHVTVETFVKALCDYSQSKKGGKRK